MNMIQRAALSPVPGNHKVIAGGPITLQPHSRAYRVVIANWGDKLSVHQEIFDVDKADNADDLAEACRNAESWLDQGSYFGYDELHKAQSEFANRLTKHAYHVESIYRDVQAAA